MNEEGKPENGLVENVLRLETRWKTPDVASNYEVLG